MTVEKITAVVRVSTPTVVPLPVTDDSQSVILEPYHVALLPEYGYASKEYLISGKAYGEPYCTRLLLRCPDDASRFTGFVVMEPSHLWGGTSIWRHTSRWLMRNGHAWLEVDSQATSAVGNIKNVDPERYKGIRFIPGPISDEFAANIPFITDATKEVLSEAYMDFKAKWWPATLQSPEILTAASHALRSGALGLIAQRVILSGLSQTGGVTRRFITHSSHLRLPNGSPPFEGFLPCQSGGDALPDVPGAKIIELVGEAEFQSVRFPCGIGGQMLGTAHRRPDSDTFRLYEVACMAHRESRWASPAELKRWSVADLHGAEWSTFANSFIYHTVFEAMENWTQDADICPSPGATIDTICQSDDILRDEYGNAVGGVRTVHSDAPLATFVAATPKGRPNWYWGSQWTFSPEKMQVIYKSVEN
ncbi:hypothetical protein CRV24_005045 [Beauveria bassiana]|nr:hypothetical protein CRV24_005045 [Beauveria bassiana]KAH8711688.1 hypothetical protein HC256_008501 [Beauveria bassiana]